MPEVLVPYDGHGFARIKIDVHGTITEEDVLVDTGFTAGTGFGLKLPYRFANYARVRGTGFVTVADDRRVAGATVPDIKILEIEGNRLAEPVIVPAIFIGTTCAIGVKFLQRCVCTFDGPARRLKIRF